MKDVLLRLYSIYRPLLIFSAAALVWLGLSRVWLVSASLDQVLAENSLVYVLLQGLRFDSVLLCMLLAVPFLLTPLFAVNVPAARAWTRFLEMLLPAAFGVLVFMELSTPAFIDEYGTRPNYQFVEYLRYPREVFSTLFAGYKLQLLMAAVLVPVLVLAFRYALRRRAVPPRRLGVLPALALAAVSVPLLTLGIRSTLDHRPVNPSTVAVTENPLVNSLPLNSTYSVLYAVYERRHEDEIARETLTLTEAELLAGVRAELEIDAAAYLGNVQVPTLHRQAAAVRRDRPLNLVIVLQESLGAEFVGALGGLPLTPNLDALADDGIWFENLYATGTRSVQGIEAVVTGFLPTRASSVVKLGGAQEDFFTLAELLARHAYSTSFIYGGDADFDNMRRFFMNNGFDRVIDERSFENPVFRSSWGVSDEDVYAAAHRYFLEQPADRPFFSLLFTTSNHAPFEIPPGRISPYDPGENTVNNAVQYADHALGEFVRRARQAPYWDNTLFLIVADHNSRVKGTELVPVERFHIPGLLLGADIKPARITRLASQIDLLPSLLSWMGVDAAHPAIGDDLTRPDVLNAPGRAVMRYQDNLAYREGDRVVISMPGKALQQYRYANGTLTPDSSTDIELQRRARIHFEWPIAAYRAHAYRLPAGSPPVDTAARGAP